MTDVTSQLNCLRALWRMTPSSKSIGLIDDVEAYLKEHGAETHRASRSDL
ncbi:MAG: hypothetical protein R3C40_07690 [Parvularculaceae bacterium]